MTHGEVELTSAHDVIEKGELLQDLQASVAGQNKVPGEAACGRGGVLHECCNTFQRHHLALSNADDARVFVALLLFLSWINTVELNLKMTFEE